MKSVGVSSLIQQYGEYDGYDFFDKSRVWQRMVNLTKVARGSESVKGCWVVFFNLIQILIEHSVRNNGEPDQTPHIRRRILRRLIWLCTVCRYPIKRTPGLNGLT